MSAEALAVRLFQYLIKAESGGSLLKAQELLFRTEELLSDLLIMPIDRAASIEFDRLRDISKVRKIGRADFEYCACQSSDISNEKFTPLQTDPWSEGRELGR